MKAPGPQLEPRLGQPVRLPARIAQPVLPGGPVPRSIRGLSYRYGNGHQALRDVSLDIHAAKCAAVIGANGAGKSTLARHLIGLSK